MVQNSTFDLSISVFSSDNENMRNSRKSLTGASVFFFIWILFVQPLSADSSYVVKKGDTLYSISRKYELTVAELRAANNLSESDILKAGEKLIIPSADISNAAALSGSGGQNETVPAPSEKNAVKTVSYTVQKGDTLYGIARKNGIKLPELLSLNNIDTSVTIKAGQKLLVPASSSSYAESSWQKSDSSGSGTSPVKPAEKNGAPVDVKGVVWPLSNPVVKNINGKVSGVRLTGADNESVKAVREGTVMYTGVYRGFGEVVFVQSKTGLIYSYTGLNRVSVKKGEYVMAGDVLGKTGRGSAADIMFMVFQNGMPVEPAKAPRG